MVSAAIDRLIEWYEKNVDFSNFKSKKEALEFLEKNHPPKHLDSSFLKNQIIDELWAEVIQQRALDKEIRDLGVKREIQRQFEKDRKFNAKTGSYQAAKKTVIGGKTFQKGWFVPKPTKVVEVIGDVIKIKTDKGDRWRNIKTGRWAKEPIEENF